MANKCPRSKRDRLSTSQGTREGDAHTTQGTGFTYQTLINRQAYADLVTWYNAQIAQRDSGLEGAEGAEGAVASTGDTAEGRVSPTEADPLLQALATEVKHPLQDQFTEA